ncbi:MAG: NTP transferase domain-containing protein [Rhodoferax sp.]|nr:NTP transferase domain-containing protein [Rhodoferax sp.]MCF8208677.1 NTP transferase domain-containing protein [Rhodoferax sp.]
MLLAAGRGERMRPLTDATPKPLLMVRGKPLMQWPLEALARGGFDRVVVNTAWLGEHIEARFGPAFVPQGDAHAAPHGSVADSGHSQQASDAVQTSRATGAGLLPMSIAYSREGRDFGAALETAGGVVRALPLLCPEAAAPHVSDVFWVVAGDVFAPDFAFTQAAVDRFQSSDMLAHLWLVPNPEHHPRGDFGLAADPGFGSSQGLALNLSDAVPGPRWTYSTIGLYRKALFEAPWSDIPAGNPTGVRAALAPLLRTAMDQRRVSAELYTGRWADIGTVARLDAINHP